MHIEQVECEMVHVHLECYDFDGFIETARQGGEACEASVVDERKIDQVVLDKYRVVVAALQETKWFGSKVSKVGDSVVLTSGREVPIGSGVRQRGEGVAIVLAGPAVHAWKAGRCKWKAWSSRPVTATLDVGAACVFLLAMLQPVGRIRIPSLTLFSRPSQQSPQMSRDSYRGEGDGGLPPPPPPF